MFDTFNDVVGVGAELSTLEELLQQVASELDLNVSVIPTTFASSPDFARSDQIAFAKAGIPALLIMEESNYRNTPPEKGYLHR